MSYHSTRPVNSPEATRMLSLRENLWSLAQNGQTIDASALADALERQAAENAVDFRTRLLIRDSLDALARHWGRDRLAAWVAESPTRAALERGWRQEVGPTGFASLSYRIMDATRPDTVLQFLRELGTRLPAQTRLEIGGAIALILAGVLSRSTEDIDVVDEVPASLRLQHDLLRELSERYGLALTHFQSHYLPARWNTRLHALGSFGKLEVLLVDPVDIFIGKLFSARAKDRDDLRALAPQFDKALLLTRLRDSAGGLMADERLAQQAATNWYILYGESLTGSLSGENSPS